MAEYKCAQCNSIWTTGNMVPTCATCYSGLKSALEKQRDGATRALSIALSELRRARKDTELLIEDLWDQIEICIDLHHPLGIHDNELSSYGQGARDALRAFKNTLRKEWLRVVIAARKSKLSRRGKTNG